MCAELAAIYRRLRQVENGYREKYTYVRVLLTFLLNRNNFLFPVLIKDYILKISNRWLHLFKINVSSLNFEEINYYHGYYNNINLIFIRIKMCNFR